MATSDFCVIIMAAGKGTRLKSKRPKVLHEIGGQALLLHVIAAAEKIADPAEIFCIIGHEADRVRNAVCATGVGFVLQTEQLGTGHALQMVRGHFADNKIAPPKNLMVLSGDVPLIRPKTLADLKAFHQDQNAAMTILTAVPSDPTGYGRVYRASEGSVEVSSIVEQKDLEPDAEAAPEINTGIYCFGTAELFGNLDNLSDNNANEELYLTDVAALLVKQGKRVVAIATDNVDEVLGANTIAEMMHLDASMRLTTARKLMAQGVTIFRPDTCVIDSSVTVEADTIIEPYVQLLGDTKIGADCHIRSHSVIEDSTLGAEVVVRQGCILQEAQVANGARLGPYAHLRSGSDIGEEAHVGNFVETKKTRLGKGSKANHLSYLGDAEIGNGVNIGAGTITCNYDGVQKRTTHIGDNAFVGSDSTLVAPLEIGAGAYVAAGSCITEVVPPGALALGRSRQATKPGWAIARKSRQAQLPYEVRS